MDGLHRIAGVQTYPLIVGEKTYTLRTWTVGTHAEMENEIIGRRGDPLINAAKACDAVPARHHAAIWTAAFDATKTMKWVTMEDRLQFETTTSGMAWQLWASLRADHPEIKSWLDGLDIILQMGPARLNELLTILAVVRQEYELKKSSGPEATTGPVNSEPLGPESSPS